MNSFFIHRRYVRWGTSVYTIKPTEDSDKEIKIINGASRKDIDGGDIYLKEIKDLSDDDFEYSIINTLVKKISILMKLLVICQSLAFDIDCTKDKF